MAARAAAALALALAPVAAMRGDFDYGVSPGEFVQYYAFGALSGASFSQDIEITNAGPDPSRMTSDVYMWGVIASSGQFSDIVDMGYDGVCTAGTDMTRVAFAAQKIGFSANVSASAPSLPTNWTLASLPVPGADTYAFLLISCTGNWGFDVHVDYHYVNPGGEELSSGRIPVKPTTLAALAAWSGLAVMLLANVGLARWAWRKYYYDAALAEMAAATLGADPEESQLSPVRSLHWALLAIPVFSVIHAAIVRGLYLQASSTGVFNLYLTVAAVVVDDVVTGALVCVILALSLGWQITRPRLEAPEVRQIMLVGGVYALVLACYSAIGGFFFLLLVLLVYVVVMRYVFASVQWRLRVLGTFRAYVADFFSTAAPTTTVASLRAPGSAAAAAAAGATAAAAASPASASAPAVAADAGGSPAAGDAAASAAPLFAGGASASASGGGHDDDEEAGGVGLGEHASLMHARSSSVAAAAGGGRAGAVTGGGLMPVRRTWSDWLPWSAVSRRAQSAYNATLSTRQMYTLRHFRTAVGVFMSIGVVVNVWPTLTLVTASWVMLAVEQALNVCMFLYLFWQFRARADPSQNVLFDPRGYAAAHVMSQQLMDGQHHMQAQLGPLGSGGPAGSPHAGGGAGSSSRMVVVQNPDVVDTATGKAVPSVALAELVPEVDDAAGAGARWTGTPPPLTGVDASRASYHPTVAVRGPRPPPPPLPSGDAASLQPLPAQPAPSAGSE